MLFFSLSFAVGVAALLVVQKMDIECVNQPKSKRFAPKRKAVSRIPASPSVLGGAIYLRQQ